MYSILILLSCTLAHGLRPKFGIYSRRQDDDTRLEPIQAEEVHTETQTIAALVDSNNPEAEDTEKAPNGATKPEGAPDNEAVEQKEEAEPELREAPESEVQFEQHLEQNDQESINEPASSSRIKVLVNSEESVATNAQTNESEPPEPAESTDQKDVDVAMRAQDPTNDNQVNDDEVKSVISNYFNAVPDINSQYVLNEGLAKSITHYFKNKVVALPLFHINLKIDRNLVKIPWESGQPQAPKKRGSYPYRVLPGLLKSDVELPGF